MFFEKSEEGIEEEGKGLVEPPGSPCIFHRECLDGDQVHDQDVVGAACDRRARVRIGDRDAQARDPHEGQRSDGVCIADEPVRQPVERQAEHRGQDMAEPSGAGRTHDAEVVAVAAPNEAARFTELGVQTAVFDAADSESFQDALPELLAGARFLINAPLLDIGHGLFAGDTTLPMCVRKSMTWIATVISDGPRGRYRAGFEFVMLSR